MTENEVIEIINTLSEKFGIAIDWTQQNIQPYMQDLMSRVVQYKLITNIILSVMLLIGIVACTIAFYQAVKKVTSNNIANNYDLDISEVISFIIMIFSSIFFIVGIVILPSAIDHIIECICFPEKVFIEELKTIIH